MNKPFTLLVNETREKIIAIINNSQLPAFCIKVILNDILNQIQQIDEKEIEKYKNELNNNKNEKKEKEG